jgi:hypothetical protein
MEIAMTEPLGEQKFRSARQRLKKIEAMIDPYTGSTDSEVPFRRSSWVPGDSIDVRLSEDQSGAKFKSF